MNQSLTIVLPLYNRERQLRRSVLDILELSQSICARLEVVIVDDGSSDETYETACELSRAYPQVTVFRQSVRRGIEAALDLVRHRLSLDMVVVHDGVTPVDASQLKTLLQAPPRPEETEGQTAMREAAVANSTGSRRFASIRSLQKSMEQAHRAVIGFRWMQLQKPIVPRRSTANLAPLPTSISNNATDMPSLAMPTVL